MDSARENYSYHPSTTGRYYKTLFQNHDANVLGINLVRNGDNQEIITVDNEGGLKRIETSTLLSESLDLFDDSNYIVNCVAFSDEKDVLFLGLSNGCVWKSDFKTTEQLPYIHDNAITALTAFRMYVISAGDDYVIKMFGLSLQQVIASVTSESPVQHLLGLGSISGFPIAVGNVEGHVSIWSPQRLKNNSLSVQNCCAMQGTILTLNSLRLFNRTCLVAITRRWIRIWAVSIIQGEREILSLLKNSIYSLVRSIPVPEMAEFTCFTTMQSHHDSPPSLLAGCADGSVYQWDALSGMQLRKFLVSSTAINFIQFIPSSHMFATVDAGSCLAIVDPNSSALIDRTNRSDVSQPLTITCACASDIRGIIVVSGDTNGVLHMRSGRNTESSSEKVSGSGAVSAVAIVTLELDSSDDIVVVSGHVNGSIQLLSCATNGVLITFSQAKRFMLQPYASTVINIQSLSKDRLATVAESESVIIWKVSSSGASKLKTLDTTLRIRVLTFSPLGYLAGGSAESSIVLWDTVNWKKVAEKSYCHNDDPITGIGIMYDRSKDDRYIVTTSKSLSHIKLWRRKGSAIVFDGMIEMSSNCANILFWQDGESSLVFKQSNRGDVSMIDLCNSRAGVIRHFSEGGSKLLSVSGESSPIVLTMPSNSSSISIWNNDLHDEQAFHTSFQVAFDIFCEGTHPNISVIDKLIRSHPSFPGCLILPDPFCHNQNLFAKAVLRGRSDFVVAYLPLVPTAVTCLCRYRDHQRSLLWLSIKRKDITSTDVILEMWCKLLAQNPSSAEECEWHVAELFSDLRLLSREQPAKFCDFIKQLRIPKAHTVEMDGCIARPIGINDLWMHGSTDRVVPGFWEAIKSEPYPDISSRLFSDDEGVDHLRFEIPHSHSSVQQPYVEKIEVIVQQESHPSISVKRNSEKLVIEEVDLEGDSAGLQQGTAHELVSVFDSSPGVMVQGYIHPIPYAAAGVEFLKLCQKCSISTGQSSVMASPAVATIIDYKWKTYFCNQYLGTVLHYLFLLVLFSINCVYFSAAMDAPSETGLPSLAWIVTCFLIASYFLLFIQENLRFLAEGLYSTLTDHWYFIGIGAYILAISGLVMSLQEGGVQVSITFNSRATLAAASLLLYLKILHILLPMEGFGLLMNRVFMTISKIRYNFLLLIIGICAFSISFNLMYHRADDEFSTYESLYGSFLQTITYAFGGFTTEFSEHADSPLYMSLYVITFIFVVLWILVIMLIAAACETFTNTYEDAYSTWKAYQAKVIIAKAQLLSDFITDHHLQNPKWLHILAPVGRVEALDGRQSSLDVIPQGCNCYSSDNDSENQYVVLKRDVDLLKDLMFQLNDRLDSINSKQPKDIDESALAQRVTELFRKDIDTLLQQRPAPPREDPPPQEPTRNPSTKEPPRNPSPRVEPPPQEPPRDPSPRRDPPSEPRKDIAPQSLEPLEPSPPPLQVTNANVPDLQRQVSLPPNDTRPVNEAENNKKKKVTKDSVRVRNIKASQKQLTAKLLSGHGSGDGP